jgi:hypothetical protein
LNGTERQEPPLDTTVVVPVWGPYAGEPRLEAIESLRAQEVPAQLIVVDNSSNPPLGRSKPLNWFAPHVG